MRLYLSSFHLGNHPEKFVELAGANKRVALISNALDFLSPEKRGLRVEEETRDLKGLGLEVEELDLRAYFGKAAALEKSFARFGLVWVNGGNSFILKRAFEQSGFGALLQKRLAADDLVYAGYSAGVAVLAPTLRGIELCDPPDSVPEGYKAAFDWEGLGLIPYSIVPHYRSPHPESPFMEEIVAFMEKEGLAYRTLKDGEAIWHKDGVEQIV